MTLNSIHSKVFVSLISLLFSQMFDLKTPVENGVAAHTSGLSIWETPKMGGCRLAINIQVSSLSGLQGSMKEILLPFKRC